MMSCLFLFVFMISIFLGAEGYIPGTIAIVMTILSLVLLRVSLFSRPKYEEAELLCSCDVLPIINDVYAIKTCKDQILCKYVDFEDENKIKLDVITIKTYITVIPEDETPKFYLYERKVKNRWLWPECSDKYIGYLSIPYGSVICE